LKLDLIKDQGEGTRRFQRLGSDPRHHQRDYQTIFESIKDYPTNISLFIHMTTAKRVHRYLIFTVHFGLFHSNGNGNGKGNGKGTGRGNGSGTGTEATTKSNRGGPIAQATTP
jgi:hypothetical protein